MASRPRRRRHRARPAPGEVRAVLDGYVALAGDGELPGVPDVVARMWEAATCADATPARAYLSRRGCWPGRHVPGVPVLPATVRWLARAEAPVGTADWSGLPAGAAGAVVFAWWPARRASNPGPVAVSLVALDARAFPVPNARCTVGTCARAVFRAGDSRDEAAVTVEADAEGRPHAQRRIKGRFGLCTDCRGEGGHWTNGRFEPCETCDGTGEVPREDREGTT